MRSMTVIAALFSALAPGPHPRRELTLMPRGRPLGTPPQRGCRAGEPGMAAGASPADSFSLQLIVEPFRERREVIDDRRRVHLSRAGERLERVGPRTRLSHRQHRVQPPAGLLALVGRAAVEWQGAARNLRQRAVELELQDRGEEIARVGRVVRHVVLRAGIEELY